MFPCSFSENVLTPSLPGYLCTAIWLLHDLMFPLGVLICGCAARYVGPVGDDPSGFFLTLKIEDRRHQFGEYCIVQLIKRVPNAAC